MNKNHSFYNSILNKFWSSLPAIKHQYIQGEKEQNVYTLKFFKPYTNPERREDFIYKESFKAGDILYYKNNDDIIYSIKDNK